MKNALLYSFGFHLAVGFIWIRIVEFTHVVWVPREVITVQMISLDELQPKVEKRPPVEEKVEPPPPEPAPEEKEPEEIAPPPESKPKPPKKEEKKAEVKKTMPPKSDQPEVPSAEVDSTQSAVPQSTGHMVLDTEEFPFHYYLTTMKRKIAANWSVPGAGQARYCVVHFRVSGNGSIDAPSIETPSGNFLFDQAALRAVVQASPLPPLPPGFPDDYLGVHFSFAYEQE